MLSVWAFAKSTHKYIHNGERVCTRRIYVQSFCSIMMMRVRWITSASVFLWWKAPKLKMNLVQACRNTVWFGRQVIQLFDFIALCFRGVDNQSRCIPTPRAHTAPPDDLNNRRFLKPTNSRITYTIFRIFGKLMHKIPWNDFDHISTMSVQYPKW